MGEHRIDDLRKLLAEAAARDEELQHGLEAVGTDLAREIGGGEESAAWENLQAGENERQVSEHFVMQDKWLRGRLEFAVTPEKKFAVGLLIRKGPHDTHEVAIERELSKTSVIDPPDATQRAEAHKKLVERVYTNLEFQVRQSVLLPPG